MVQIKDKFLPLPIIQGGMGIGVSLGGLAGHVARHGAMGVVSAANTGFSEPDFWKNPVEANTRALQYEIRKAKEISLSQGLVAVNVMAATTHYPETVAAAIAVGVDAIISGAGLPSELPALAAGSGVAIAPIVSSGKAARTICRLWDKHHGICPDFVVLEGPMAGGHLGFRPEELMENTAPTLEEILPQVLEALGPFVSKYQREIPVFVAGGVYTGGDIARFAAMGAAGAQIATRFIATHECDASPAYKQRMLDARKEDVVLLKSPVGMPGRGLLSPLTQQVALGNRVPVSRCSRCLHPCDPAVTPYCITRALIEAHKGNWEEGLFFCGSNVWRLDKLLTVEELLNELQTEWREAP